jgi:hypothetical protein
MNVNREGEPTDAVGGAGAATGRVANSPLLPERVPPRARAQTVRLEFPPATIIRLILVVAGLWLLIRLWPVFLVLVVALLIVGTLSPAVSWMEARRSRPPQWPSKCRSIGRGRTIVRPTRHRNDYVSLPETRNLLSPLQIWADG